MCKINFYLVHVILCWLMTSSPFLQFSLKEIVRQPESSDNLGLCLS